MNFHCWLLSALLIVPTSFGIAGVDEPLDGPRASWEEPGAQVLAFSRDARTLVTSRREGIGFATHLRDATTGRIRAQLTAPGVGLHSPLFSPDGRLLFATVSSDRYQPVTVLDLKVWVVATGATYATFHYVMEGIIVRTAGYALSGDGQTLAFMDNSERLPMQVVTSKSLMDGRHEVTFARNANPGLPRVKIWDVPGWKETGLIDGGSHVVFSPDGKTLVTGSRDWKVPVAKVWDTATQLQIAELVGKAPWVEPRRFSADGRFLAGGGSTDLTLWELPAVQKWALAAGRHNFGAPVFSPDGRVLFPVGMPRRGKGSFNSRELPCYDLRSLPPRPLELGDGELMVSPDARRYASVRGGGDRTAQSIIAFHDLPDLRETGRFAVESLINAAFSPDGRRLVLLEFRREKIPGDADWRFGRRIRVLDVDTCRVLATIPTAYPTGWNDPTWEFSPDLRTLAVTYWRGLDVGEDALERPMTVDLWDLPAP